MGTDHGQPCVHKQDSQCSEMKSSFETAYPPSEGAFVNAIGGDGVENIVWRIYQEGVAGLNPYVCVVYVGSNELSKGQEATQVAAGVQAILKALHFFLPNTEFLLVGLLPRADDVFFKAVRARGLSRPSLPFFFAFLLVLDSLTQLRVRTSHQSPLRALSFCPAARRNAHPCLSRPRLPPLAATS